MTRYFLTVLLALDELINAITGGYADETISERLAIDNSEGKLVGCVFCRIMQLLIPDHCSLTKPGKAARLTRGGKK